MGAMDEVFGERPQRPDTEEFWRLSAIALELKALEETVSKYVGLEEIVYLATQRAMRVLNIHTRVELVPRIADVMRLAAMFMDGFTMGCKWIDER